MPRGITKERAKIDLWMKEIAPSPELRKWYAHDVEKWPEFRKRYLEELKNNKDQLFQLQKLIKEPVTFIYAAKDEEHNSALVLKRSFGGVKNALNSVAVCLTRAYYCGILVRILSYFAGIRFTASQ